MEAVDSFDEAVQYLSSRQIISAGYFIVGGTKSGEGVVISRNATGLAGPHMWMNSTDHKWYEHINPHEKFMYTSRSKKSHLEEACCSTTIHTILRFVVEFKTKAVPY